MKSVKGSDEFVWSDRRTRRELERNSVEEMKRSVQYQRLVKLWQASIIQPIQNSRQIPGASVVENTQKKRKQRKQRVCD